MPTAAASASLVAIVHSAKYSPARWRPLASASTSTMSACMADGRVRSAPSPKPVSTEMMPNHTTSPGPSASTAVNQVHVHTSETAQARCLPMRRLSASQTGTETMPARK